MNTIDYLNELGEKIEFSRETNNRESLNSLIKIGEIENTDFYSNYEKSILNYFIANAYSYKNQLIHPNRENFPFETPELEKQITHLRIAISLIDNENPYLKCQILTNLGSLFSHLGRVSEAQEYFDKCLNIDSNFGMAIGNKGFALGYYSKLIFDKDQQLIFLREARKYLLKSIDCNDIYEEAKLDFQKHLQEINKYIPKEYLKAELKYDYKHKNKTKEELDYRKWCSSNRLFVNPLNDIFDTEIVEHDYLFVPSMTLKNDEKPIYQSIFNQIKQEYITSRYFFYESLLINKVHFADKDVTLMNINDFSIYSIHIEKIKISFRMSYSIFDKIAYLINIYFDLGHSNSNVNFRNVWFKNKGKNKTLHEKIQSSNNWALRSLYWLSKDFYDKDFNNSIEPESVDIATIRNFLEHKSFKIIEAYIPNWTNQTETYEIERELFYDKTFKLLKTCRSALMYLTFSLYLEEEKKGKGSITIPIEFLKMEDDDKI